MNGKALLEWLEQIPDLESCEIFLEVPGDFYPLVTAKVYDEDGDGRLDKIYLVHK